MGKSSAPAAPDYTAQAKATSQGNLELAKYATQANRINQFNPYGSLTYSKSVDPTTGQENWTQQTNLSPDQQQLLEQQQQTKLGIGGLQGGALQNLQNEYSQPFEMQSVQDIADKAYGNYTARLDPQWAQRQQQVETQLANQGIAPGTEAYTNAMRDFNAAKNDAYTQAQTASFNLMPQTYNLAASARNQPAQELQGLMGLSQFQMPSFGTYAQQNQVAGPDYLGAANAQYQNQLAANNAANAGNANMFSGLLGLGGSLLGGIGSAGGWSKFWG